MTVDQQRSGQRVYDINMDGVAHYGLYPDWIEDLRKHRRARTIVDDMARGPEAYLQMWERADGVQRPAAARRRARLTRARPHGRADRRGAGALLRRAGQPKVRGARAWTYCVKRRPDGGGADAGGRVALVGSTARVTRPAGSDRG